MFAILSLLILLPIEFSEKYRLENESFYKFFSRLFYYLFFFSYWNMFVVFIISIIFLFVKPPKIKQTILNFVCCIAFFLVIRFIIKDSY